MHVLCIFSLRKCFNFYYCYYFYYYYILFLRSGVYFVVVNLYNVRKIVIMFINPDNLVQLSYV